MAKPTINQIEWAKKEFGVIIHYDITVFEPSYQFRKQWGYHPDPKVFNPVSLNTDQWIKTAKDAGAKYAVLVAKHCTGFCLWPTEPYSVKHSSYKGDIVEEFVRSCKKYGLRPGLYYSCSCNGYMKVDNPGRVLSGDPHEQSEYIALVERQLTELWSRYGEMFEIWFDGGILSVKDGGPNLKPIYDRFQHNAVRFQGFSIDGENNTRWVGNERGIAPYDCWSSTGTEGQFDGTVEDESTGTGNPDGRMWAPAECDTPNRTKEWFWKKEEEYKVISADKLTDIYYQSVGRNCNLLLGMVIDDRGLVPEKDAEQMHLLGERIKHRFANPLASAKGKDRSITISFEKKTYIDHIVICENIENGHCVRDFSVELIRSGKPVRKISAKAIGNNRIFRFSKTAVESVKLIINECVGQPEITDFSCYCADDYTLREKLKLTFEKIFTPSKA